MNKLSFSGAANGRECTSVLGEVTWNFARNSTISLFMNKTQFLGKMRIPSAETGDSLLKANGRTDISNKVFFKLQQKFLSRPWESERDKNELRGL